MRLMWISAIFLLTASLVVTTIQAGTLGQDLEQLMASAAAENKVKVWIKLPAVDPGRRLESTGKAIGATGAVRHQRALSQLKTDHASAQQAVLEQLQTLESVGKAASVRSHWIVNVVEAEVAVSELGALAARSDIETIQRVPDIYLIRPTESTTFIADLTALPTQSNLTYIKADQAWVAGYTGAGRLVCSFDTGVEGTHDALYESWKGHDGDSSAAWFDPMLEEPFPERQSSGDPITDSHGTHVAGIMVGHKDSSGDTTGVAPDAKWISARVIDVGSNAILRAFEWAADPDGNPNTVSDVPDVINHSWGYERAGWNIACQDIYFDAIEAIEDLGIVNVFAAGNSGSTAMTIANPAIGADDSISCFAVGNLNHTIDLIASNSSRGPSDCNGATKPNVVAPGSSIRSSKQSNTFGLMDGTSMAAPHVSGLVALLRQKNPNATVDEIKTAILTSATGHANFGPLPNNTYGWGRIDCMAALAALDGPSSSLNVRMYDFNYSTVSPGDTVVGTVVVECLGGDVTNVSGTITGSHPALTVLDGSAFFGDMTHGDTLRSNDSIRVVVSDTVTAGQILSIDFLISGNGLSIPSRLSFLVDPPLSKSVVTHNTGRIQFSLSNFGVYGLGPVSVVVGPGEGFTFDGSSNEWYEAGLIIGTGGLGSPQVSSAVHSYVVEPNNDFRVAPGGNMQFTESLDGVAQQTFCRFNDSNALNPIGIEVTQESFATTGINSDFIIMRYILRNLNQYDLDSVFVGLFLDWDVVSYLQNVGGFEAADSVGWIAQMSGGSVQNYRATKLLQGPLASVVTDRGGNVNRHYIPADGGDGFEKWEKYLALTEGFGTADIHRDVPGEMFQLTSAGPLNFVPGGLDTVAFAILAGATLDDVQDAAMRSQAVITDVKTPSGSTLPNAFILHQNYPNPFNASTVISFDLPKAAEYKLKVYNILGQLIHEETGKSRAGRVTVNWNAGSYASGVYFYKVEIGDYSETRKMLLLK